ncbi:DNA-binding response regulator [Burkholderia sp. WAC0059]|uniref:response regulator transcription factor n=1 Tax=Burkholderia sp. WAC0059 TaxID=2066022 RepID=UPI000C7ECFFE|nr:response regulator transcription factor [Burkholderia sp. WAC0059]PLY99939.1 DNA-binding response regulator [Burkholderia sp. WAC0059]
MKPSITENERLLPGPLLIVEDEPMAEQRLRSILIGLGYTLDALQFAADMAQARAAYAAQPFALVLTDIGLPDGSGVDLIREWYLQDPSLPILVISAWSTADIIVKALQAGAVGYLLKERDDIEIALSIRSALRGGAPIDPFIARYILSSIVSTDTETTEKTAHQVRLTARQTEILCLVSRGLTNREISLQLSLSLLTVECHIRNIYKKLAVRSRTQALFEARSLGLLR